ncbi:MAG: glycosyltransferase [Lachnospiraceae bacterium]|nr:glycosyltransferase [Lachnospiraceae bacterium]
MKLSIIVPVYNMAADSKLAFCLDSLVHQSFDDYEIIAVDDASTDDSLEVLREYETKYPDRIKVLARPENGKQGAAKNTGLDVARGEFVGFVDSDDWIDPDMYTRMIALAEDTGADMVGCDYCMVNAQGFTKTDRIANSRPEQTGVLTPDKYKSLILDSGSLVVKIYKRELFESPALRFPEKTFYEDNAIATELMLRAKHYEYIPEALYYYYQHGGSTVHVITRQRCENRLDSMRLMLQHAKESGILEKYRDEIEFRFTNLFYQNTLFTYMQGVKRTEPGFVKALGKEMREAFPEFQENPYYKERINAEEKKFMALQQRSTIGFILYYKLIYLARKIRYGK